MQWQLLFIALNVKSWVLKWINICLCSSETMSGWSQPLMGGPVMHQQMQEPSAFSQHQAMERDDTGIVAPSNTFHQPLPANFMDFPKVHTRAQCGIVFFNRPPAEFLTRTARDLRDPLPRTFSQSMWKIYTYDQTKYLFKLTSRIIGFKHDCV